jgi:dTDP-glucose 4,6-dehydratase
MANHTRTILVTGGAGFIGSHLIRRLLESTHHRVINLDSLTYASNLESLSDFAEHDRYDFIQGDICQADLIQSVFQQHQPSCVMNLAAESHVDRSIDSPAVFLESNVIGTFGLLEASRKWFAQLPQTEQSAFRFIQVSTDEVFGSLQKSDPECDEATAYAPRSPYAASKASADHLVNAWNVTYGLPTITTRCSNNYGPHQYPEKLIPVVINAAKQNQPIPVYGTGQNIRDWIHVSEHVDALLAVLQFGHVGTSYNITGNCERSNISVVQSICQIMDDLLDRPQGAHAKLIQFVSDRPGHDFRYAMNCDKLTSQLGWEPKMDFITGLKQTVEWYLSRDVG